jgi:FecR protein.
MESIPSPQEEIVELVDLMVDHQIDARGYARLEALLRSDQGCLQAYVDRLHFHSELIQFSDFRTSEAAVLQQLAEYDDSERLRQNRSFIPAFAICAMALIAIVSAMGYLTYGRSTRPVGTISGMTSDIEFNTPPVKPGELIRARQTIQINKGILTARFGEVMVDLIGPVSVQVQDRSLINLKDGTLIANVTPNGIGFTVKTSDVETVDLGTQFLVKRSRNQGTQVSVQKGRVHASLLDRNGDRKQVMEITTSRSAKFSMEKETVAEQDFSSEPFEIVANARGSITSIDGLIRTSTERASDLRSGRHYTPNYILVIPEQQNITIHEPLTLSGLNGTITIPEGAVICSYLVHYEPDTNTYLAPRGAVSFDGQIAAVLVNQSALAATDPLFGIPGVTVEKSAERGLELDEDEIRVSDDRKTVSFYFGASGGKPVDQARILVMLNQNTP